MKKVISLILTLAMLLSLCIFVQAEEVETDFNGKICTVRLKDGRYLTSATAEKKSDLVVGTTPKEWKIKEYYNNYSFEDDNAFYWDVLDVSTLPGAKLIQWSSTGVFNQIWKLEEAEDGYYIKCALSNLYVTEKDGGIIQAEKAEGENQIWVIDVVDEFEPIVDRMLESEAAMSLDEYRRGRLSAYMKSGAEFNTKIYSKVENLLKERDYFNLTLEEQKAFLEECFKLTWTFNTYGGMTTILEREVTAEYVGIIDGVWGSWHGDPGADPRLYNVTITDPETGETHLLEYVSPLDNDEKAAIVAGEALASFQFPVIRKLKRFVYTSCDTNSWNGGAGIIWNNMGYQADHYRTRSHYAHELGHVMDMQRHDIWYRAIALDMIPVSTYGNNTRWEDLADFCRMFLLYRGDDEKMAALERTYPARFLAMKGLMYEVDPVFFAEYKADFDLVWEMFGDYDKNEIVKLSFDGKYLTDNNATLALSANSNSDNQVWEIYTQDVGTSRIVNKATGNYVTVVDGRLALDDKGVNFSFLTEGDGYKMVQTDKGCAVDGDFTVNYMCEDVWKMEKLGDITGVGTFRIKTEDGKYLSLNEAGADSWVITPVTKGYYTIMDKASGRLIDILDLKKESGIEAILWQNTGADNQRFAMTENADGTVVFTAKHSNLSLTMENGKVFQSEKGTKFILEKVEDKKDVQPKDWYYDVVGKVLARRWMESDTEEVFGANEKITRGEFVESLYRANGEKAAGECKFTDVTDAFTKEAVVWAVANGIINGVSGSEFAPDAAITREQIAAIFYRYASYKAYDVSVGERVSLANFNDGDKVSAYAEEAMKWATGSGLMNGKNGGMLDPKGNTTKAETATLLVRMADEII